MAPHPSKAQLMKEVETLRRELAELRSQEGVRQRTAKGLQSLERQLAGIIQSAMDAIITTGFFRTGFAPSIVNT